MFLLSPVAVIFRHGEGCLVENAKCDFAALIISRGTHRLREQLSVLALALSPLVATSRALLRAYSVVLIAREWRRFRT